MIKQFVKSLPLWIATISFDANAYTFEVSQVETMSNLLGIEVNANATWTSKEHSNLNRFLNSNGFIKSENLDLHTFNNLLSVYESKGHQVVPSIFEVSDIKYFLFLFDVDINTSKGTWNDESKEKLSSFLTTRGEQYYSGELDAHNIGKLLDEVGGGVNPSDVKLDKWPVPKQPDIDRSKFTNWSDKTICRVAQSDNSTVEVLTEINLRGAKCTDHYPGFKIKGITIAPSPKALEKRPTNAFDEILNQRNTINVFLAWNKNRFDNKKYGLLWHGSSAHYGGLNSSFNLHEMYWNYNYINKPWGKNKAIVDFVTDENWGHAAEYGVTKAVNYFHTDFPKVFASEARKHVERSSTGGVMLDWWHNYHQNYNPKDVEAARIRIAKELRKTLDEDSIILANTNDNDDFATHDYINGVFLEMSKSKPKERFSSSKISKYERILIQHNQKLRYPKLIAFEPWKVTENQANPRGDFHSETNIKFAKLFTAMASVIPENGYILYAENNQDSTDGDHYHVFYDFYNIDLGKPTSSYTKITNGVAYKTYEDGLIAYNRTTKPITIRFPMGQPIQLASETGIFCKEIEEQLSCK